MLAHTPASLTSAQLDGIECIVCASDSGPMVPVDVIEGCQVFAHRTCVDEPADAPTVLVVGKADTADDVADLTAFAFDAADRLQMPAKVATSMDYDVTDFAGVVLADNWLDSTASVVLGVEAQQADLCVLDSDALYVYEPTKTCAHCGEQDDEAAPILQGDTWTVSVCPGCVDAFRRLALPGVLASA